MAKRKSDGRLVDIYAAKPFFKMRQTPKIPRIIKIVKIDFPVIVVVFNNGETRQIDFKKSFPLLFSQKKTPGHQLSQSAVFKNLVIENNALSWPQAGTPVSFKGKTSLLPFEIGADTLYSKSTPFSAGPLIAIGAQIKTARQKAGLTQSQLAERSGTTRTYISRIEHDASGIEMSTLAKIVQFGLGKKLEIKIG